ncbi:UNVERIFIED_CONTAM: hypothetical protein Scaly_2095900 [Sesamum calycinum]|uniref:Uncharacterized protein n=1 Tax=Sesamum calycinum TaxID=2727403 RepID=A0AAW2MM97_9LAMI
MLNKAYKVLMKDDLRKQYDASIGKISDNLRGGSIWEGSLRPQALFVDENACIGKKRLAPLLLHDAEFTSIKEQCRLSGCRECVHHAGNTFMMDEVFGTARVKVQYGDDEERIETSVDSCPVNCIHWVDTEELEVLEYLIQPQAKVGYGIYGQGWERPANVFMAAKSFNKQLKQQTKPNRDVVTTLLLT